MVYGSFIKIFPLKLLDCIKHFNLYFNSLFWFYHPQFYSFHLTALTRGIGLNPSGAGNINLFFPWWTQNDYYQGPPSDWTILWFRKKAKKSPVGWEHNIPQLHLKKEPPICSSIYFITFFHPLISLSVSYFLMLSALCHFFHSNHLSTQFQIQPAQVWQMRALLISSRLLCFVEHSHQWNDEG